MRFSPHLPLRRTFSVCLIGAVTALSLSANAAQSAPARTLSASNGIAAQQKALVAEARNKVNATRGSTAGEVFENPYRAYPPSCFNNGLPQNGYAAATAIDVQQGQMVLLGDPSECLPGANSAECNYKETDTVTLWRVACSGGKSATLLQIDRPANHSTTLYPTLPLITVNQGTTTNFPIRVGSDPNTFFSTNFANQPLMASDVFVLENYYGSGISQIDYSKAFSLTTNNQDVGANASSLAFPVPDYVAPANPPRLEITGYMSTNWSNPNQSGEGIVLQVYDNGDHASRTLAFAWFTYDKSGLPFWLFGQANVPIGANQISAPTYYFQGGTFQPAAVSATVPAKPWGFVTFTFPDCSHMNIAYNSTSNPPTPVPTGQGSTNYTRVANVNGLACE